MNLICEFSSFIELKSKVSFVGSMWMCLVFYPFSHPVSFDWRHITIYHFFKFIYFERERQHEQGRGRERKGPRESQAGSLLSAWSTTWGSNPPTVRS